MAGLLNGLGRGRGMMPEDDGGSDPSMRNGEYVDRAMAYAENLPPRGRELFARSYGPAVRSIARSREMRGLDEGSPDDGALGQADRIMMSMRARARAAGVDPNDDEAVLSWAEQHDPTDATLEAVDMIRRQMRGAGRGDSAWAPGRR